MEESCKCCRDLDFRADTDYAGANERRCLFHAPSGKDGGYSIRISLFDETHLKPATEYAKSTFYMALRVDCGGKGSEPVVGSRRAILLVGTLICQPRKEA
jgi:hypothetical protein